MKYARQKRIELSDLDVNWKGCYIVIGTRGFLQVQELQRKIGALQSEIEVLELRRSRLRKRMEDLNDEEFNLKIIDLEKMNADAIAKSDQLIKLFISVVKDGFISGVVYDAEESKSREMVASDVDTFDNELITRLASAILGSIEKKA